ncbi:vgr related protein [uncultured Erythrobacter sp.]|uniref:vgr related protein n=1 Tax=uncultured Erythrobacter sp. TaxID=263913 RepID=UPI00260ABC07|nr:vgr related protein [uncultured Erythrobacter sp.]
MGGDRELSEGEIALARSIFSDAIDYAPVRIKRRKWWPFQPKRITMAPDGHLYFHPQSNAYCDDFANAPLATQAFFIHELTHVWQTQTRGRWYLILHRHPFCRYSYTLKPGQPLTSYGIEQQAEIVKHAFLLRQGVMIAGVGDRSAYDVLVRFPGEAQS